VIDDVGDTETFEAKSAVRAHNLTDRRGRGHETKRVEIVFSSILAQRKPKRESAISDEKSGHTRTTEGLTQREKRHI
jgi:hypothetical protein